MKKRFALLILLATLILSACGQKSLSEPMTLLNQNQEEVTFPSDKPAVFFFITTYT
ncbi:lipoprotein [Bacillus mesophilum]|uniref:lipoprotein n=1 Tax=Bacillus mesophilum TaxID=1071718 RepID=UPI001863AF86|nr:lipoprotein [Bacillus mesophilum]